VPDARNGAAAPLLILAECSLGAISGVAEWEELGPRVAEHRRHDASQVVLAWLTGGELPVAALISASSVAQLEESLAAVDLQLTAEQRQLLDAAN
jgi:aryl-alcohol dehydrogenase-like predicted oxidoreductase